jgi:GNAT superfamily N-acetyltransferase
MEITFHSSGLHDASIDLEFGGVQGMLTDLFISARFRRRGIGFLALRFVEDYCRRRGIEAPELQVQRANRQAFAFYRRAGFQSVPRMVMGKSRGTVLSKPSK